MKHTDSMLSNTKIFTPRCGPHAERSQNVPTFQASVLERLGSMGSSIVTCSLVLFPAKSRGQELWRSSDASQSKTKHHHNLTWYVTGVRKSQDELTSKNTEHIWDIAWLSTSWLQTDCCERLWNCSAQHQSGSNEVGLGVQWSKLQLTELIYHM